MCAIAGILGSDYPESCLRRMQEAQPHRGPDDSGIIVFKERAVKAGICHARLAILDVSASGHQPMATSNGRHWITYNGEIYNYKELREELGGRREGQCRTEQTQWARNKSTVHAHLSSVTSEWHSNSDTEVILRAYASSGRDCVHRLRGMFAFAIWDQQEEELFLARDAYGIKPLYYYQTDNSFLFASEVRALLASGLVPRKLSRRGLVSYLESGSVQDPLTIVEDVYSLLPGHCLSVKLLRDRLQFEERSFTDSFPPTRPETQDQIPANRREAAIQLRSILEDSIRAHLVSDVPVAAFLSGGIDSSAIVALMSRVSEERPRTFNVFFDETRFSENPYADIIARKFGTDHRDVRLSSTALLAMLPDALAAMDQPTMDGINTYVVSKAVKDAGIKVALSGLGGDELFAGYPSFRRAMQLNALVKAPSAFRHIAAATGRSFTNGSVRHQKFWDLMESDCSPYAAYAISRQLFAPSEITALTKEPVRRQALSVRREASKFEIRDSQSAIESDIINAVSRLELAGYMANTLLRDTDQMSMAHALEVRVPFVDREVVNFVTGLPGPWKTDGKRPKPLLLDALGDLLPEEIWRRPKMGFTLPFEQWMRSALREDIDATFSDSASLERIACRPDYARAIWAAFKKNPQHQPWSRPWALYVLAKWCETNDVCA